MEKSAWMENIFYSTRPENANQKVLVGIHAHPIDILTEGGQAPPINVFLATTGVMSAIIRRLSLYL